MKPKLDIDWTPFDKAERAAVAALDAQERQVKALYVSAGAIEARTEPLMGEAITLNRSYGRSRARTKVTLHRRRLLIARLRRAITRYRRQWRRMIRRHRAEVKRRRFLAAEHPPGRGVFWWTLRRKWWRFRGMFR